MLPYCAFGMLEYPVSPLGVTLALWNSISENAESSAYYNCFVTFPFVTLYLFWSLSVVAFSLQKVLANLENGT